MADQLKTEGNAQLASGDTSGAIASFTRAIELDATNHVYFSNRSAARLQAGDAKAALADAERVLELRPDWPRGYSRKGAALWKQGDLGGAIAAFEAGLVHDAQNASLLQNVSQARAALAARIRPAAAAAAAAAAPRAPAATLRALLAADGAAMVQTALFLVRCFALLQAALYASPRATAASAAVAWARAFGAALVAHLCWVGWSCGRPALSGRYAMAVLQEPASQAVLYDSVWFFCGAFAPALLPLVLVEALYAAKWAAAALRVGGAPSAVGDALGAPLTRLLLPALLREPGFSALAPAARWSLLFRGVQQWRAHAEVGVGLALVVHLAFPWRSLLALVVYWQYLRMAVMLPAGVPQGIPGLSPHSCTKKSFSALDGALAPVLGHAYMPGLVGAGYRRFKQGLAWLCKLPERPQPGQPAPGLASRCVIM